MLSPKLIKLNRATLCLFLLFVWANIASYAQPTLPLIKSYEPREYQASRQNWAVDADQHGVKYFGNSAGLLSYNMGIWKLHGIPSRDIVRALKVHQDTIWTAGDREFGFFTRDSLGALTYRKLGDSPRGQTWDIVVLKGKTHFLNGNSIVVYDKTNKVQEICEHGGGFYGMTLWNGKLWALNWESQLGYLNEQNRFEPVSRLNLSKEHSSSVKLFVQNEHLHILDGENILRSIDSDLNIAKSALNTELQSYSFFSVLPLDEERIALGSISNGLVIYNTRNGLIEMRAHSNKGLIENTVLSIGHSADRKLWLGLDYGIACMEYQSETLPIFNDGASYHLTQLDGSTFISSNKGLFVSENTKPFVMVPKSQGQTWKVRKYENEVLVCHNNGLYSYQNGRLKPLLSGNGIMDIVQFKGRNRYLISAYSGLYFAKRKGDQFELIENLNYWGNPKIAYDTKHDVIWAKTDWADLIAYNLNEEEGFEYASYKGMHDFFVSEEDIIFYDGEKLYERKNDGFIELVNSPYGDIAGEGIEQLIVSPRLNRLAMIKNGRLDVLLKLPDHKYYSFQESFEMIQDHLIEGDEYLYFGEDLLFITTDRGVESFRPDYGMQNSMAERSEIALLKAWDADTLLLEYDHPLADLLQLDESTEKVIFSFGSEGGLRNHFTYRYMLEGRDKTFSEWQDYTKADYDELKGGNYTFILQSRSNGIQLPERQLGIEIGKSWRENTWWIISRYVILGTLLIIGIFILLHQNSRKHERDKSLQKSHYDKREKELKNNQLLQYAEAIGQKNKILRELKDDISDVKNKTVQRAVRKIELTMEKDHKSFIFHQLFSELHHDFLLKLDNKYPDLSKSEIRLASLIRFNLQNDEIANLLQISPKSVIVSRYRLRKKMGLSNESDLDHIIRAL